MTVGDRGKWAEAEVRKLLDKYSGWSSFTFYRMPDARAGSRQPTLADFMVMHLRQFSLLEVKEVQHAYRLPHKNFDELKVGRMRAWQMAGAGGHVVVHFALTSLWRVAPLDFFITREGGSWDMSRFQAKSLKECMFDIYGELPGSKK